MARSKLKSALLRYQGRDPIREKQKKISRRQPKRRREVIEESEGGEEGEGLELGAGEGDEAPELVNVSAKGGVSLPVAEEEGEEEEGEGEGARAEEEEEEGEGEERDGGDSGSDDSDDENDDNDEEEEIEEEEEDEEEEGGEDDIPLSDIDDSDIDTPDLLPHQKLTIDNHPALTSALSRITLHPSTLPFIEHLSITTSTPVEITDAHDDLTRELAFYKQALSAATLARTQILSAGLPFSRPTDYFAEMLKDDEHMGKIKQRMLDDAAAKEAAKEARKQRDLKKFGKQVQVAKVQEREKSKRETLEKIKVLKRKRQGAGTDLTNEADMFDVALDDAVKDSKSRPGNPRDRINHKRQKKDQKYGFGGKKRFAKSNDAKSSADLSGFSARRNKGAFPGAAGKKKGTVRLGKSRRAGKR